MMFRKGWKCSLARRQVMCPGGVMEGWRQGRRAPQGSWAAQDRARKREGRWRAPAQHAQQAALAVLALRLQASHRPKEFGLGWMSERWLTANAVLGLFPANSVADDIEIYADEKRDSVAMTWHNLRQQNQKPAGRANQCLADFIAPKESGVPAPAPLPPRMPN